MTAGFWCLSFSKKIITHNYASQSQKTEDTKTTTKNPTILDKTFQGRTDHVCSLLNALPKKVLRILKSM